MKDIRNGRTMSDITYNMKKFRGRIIWPASSSKVQLKIDHNLIQAHSTISKENQSPVSKSAQNNNGKPSFNGVLNASIAEQSGSTKETARWTEYTIKTGDTIWDLAVNKYHVNVKDIIRDNNIQDPKKIQPGDKIRIRLPSYQSVQSPQVVTASWYGADYHGKAMANGDFFNMYAPTIAHRTLPLGTRVELENKETGVKVRAVVTDRGPFVAGRDVDLSYGLAKILSIDKKGTGKLIMRVVG
jgi:rare lipoprotein A